MHRFVTLFALTLMTTSTLAVSARADEEPQPAAPTSLPAEVPLAQQVPPPPRGASSEPSTLARPKTLDEFEAVRSGLEKRLDGASEEGKLRIRKDLKLLAYWFEQDTEKTSQSGVVAGVVMLSVGGGVAVLTGVGLVLANVFNFRGGSPPATELFGAAIGGGLAVAGIGIGLIVYGSPRVMKGDPRASTTSPLAPSARLLVGPGTVGVGGTF